MRTLSYDEARARLAQRWDEVEDAQEAVILRRDGHEDLVLLPASELRSLQETVHLLRSPKNAARLFTALARSREAGGILFESADALAAAIGESADR